MPNRVEGTNDGKKTSTPPSTAQCSVLKNTIYSISFWYTPTCTYLDVTFFYNVSTRAGQCIALETIQPSGIIHNSPPFAFIHFEDKCEFVKYANVKKKNTQWRRDKFKGEDDSWFQRKIADVDRKQERKNEGSPKDEREIWEGGCQQGWGETSSHQERGTGREQMESPGKRKINELLSYERWHVLTMF